MTHVRSRFSGSPRHNKSLVKTLPPGRRWSGALPIRLGKTADCVYKSIVRQHHIAHVYRWVWTKLISRKWTIQSTPLSGWIAIATATMPGKEGRPVSRTTFTRKPRDRVDAVNRLFQRRIPQTRFMILLKNYFYAATLVVVGSNVAHPVSQGQFVHS